jgi:3-dehydroquinate synthase/2-deoxy-scyllo-inosose synthase
LVGERSIPYYLGTDCFEEIAAHLHSLETDRFILISDRKVIPRIGESLASALRGYAAVDLLEFPEGENHKTLTYLEKLAETAIWHGATRKSVLVGIGGGLVGNVTGLLAALLFRGVRFVHVPTTLLAMHDSVTSLKQAVNCGNVKNVIGAYYAPEMILADTGVLETLPLRHWRAGAVELAKNALILGNDFHELLPPLLRDIESRSSSLGRQMVKLGVRAKAGLLHTDPTEKSGAIIFEYGHTVGHALELESEGALTHGEAVAWGMLCAAEISHKLGYLSEAARQAHWDLLRLTGTLEMLPSWMDPGRIMTRIYHDNKRGACSHELSDIPMVLLQGIGVPVMGPATMLVLAPDEIVHSAISAVLHSCESVPCGQA